MNDSKLCQYEITIYKLKSIRGLLYSVILLFPPNILYSLGVQMQKVPKNTNTKVRPMQLWPFSKCPEKENVSGFKMNLTM